MSVFSSTPIQCDVWSNVSPASIWMELVIAAGYVPNRGKVFSCQQIVYELWFGRRIKHFCVSNSKCYVHIPAQQRRKIDRKAVVGYLVGYNCDERYRIYTPERRDIFVSRDVILHKTVRDCNGKIEWPFKLEKTADIKKDQNAEEKAITVSRSNTGIILMSLNQLWTVTSPVIVTVMTQKCSWFCWSTQVTQTKTTRIV